MEEPERSLAVDLGASLDPSVLADRARAWATERLQAEAATVIPARAKDAQRLGPGPREAWLPADALRLQASRAQAGASFVEALPPQAGFAGWIYSLPAFGLLAVRGGPAACVDPSRLEALRRVGRALRASCDHAQVMGCADPGEGDRAEPLLDCMPDAAVAADAEGRVRVWNRAAERMFGRSAAEALGQPLGLIIPLRLHDAHNAGFQRVLETGETRIIGVPVEVKGLHADGSEIDVEALLNQVATPDGLRFVAVLRDISARVGQRAINRLAAAAAERTSASLARLAQVVAGDLREMPAAVNQELLELLGVDRVSLWRLEKDRLVLCDRFDQPSGHQGAGESWREMDHPRFFAQLRAGALIEAQVDVGEPEMEGRAARLYRPAGVCSVLEVPIRALAGLRGMICLESRTPRRWLAEERSYIEHVAELIVHAMDRSVIQSLEARHSAVLAALADAVLAVGPENHITVVNPAALELLGCAVEDCVDQPLAHVIQMADLNVDLPERVGAVLAGERPSDRPLVVELVRRDGAHVRAAAQVVPLHRGELVVGAVLTLHDLSEIEASRRDLERQNQQLRALSEAIPDMLFSLSSEGQIQYLKQDAGHRYLVSPTDTSVHNLYSIFEPELARRLHGAAAMVLQTGGVTVIDYAVHHQQTMLHFEARMSRMGDDHVIALVRDVTEDRARAEALREQQERTAYLLSSTSAIIYSARLPDFSVEYISDSVTAVVGHAVEDCLSHSFWLNSVHPDDAERVLLGIQGLYEKGHHVQEYRHRHRDGGYRWLRDELRLVCDASGIPQRVTGAAFDITDRKRSEASLALAVDISQIVARFSAEVLRKSQSPFERTMSRALAALGERTGARRAMVGRMSEREMVLVAQWSVGGLPALDGVPAVIGHHAAAALNGEVGCEGCLSDDEMAGFDLVHLIAVPMGFAGGGVGFIGVDDPNEDLIEAVHLRSLLQVVADAVAAGLQNVEDRSVLQQLNARLAAEDHAKRLLLDLARELALAQTPEALLARVANHIGLVMDDVLVTLLTLEQEGAVARVRTLYRQLPASRVEDPSDTRLAVADLAGSALAHAIQAGIPVTTQSFGPDQFWDWKLFGERDQLTQFMVIPLVSAGGVFGTLNMASFEHLPPSEARIDWATQLGSMVAAQLSILEARDALRTLNTELERRVASRTLALQRSEDRLERLFQHAPQAMVMVDRHQRVAKSNLRAQSLFGYSDTEFQLIELSMLVPEVWRTRHREIIKEAGLLEGAKRMADRRLVNAVRKDGTEFSAEVGLVPLEVNGEPQVLAGVTDVSARLAAEEALTRSLREKETLLKEIHHRVKNNLQVISSLLMLQSDQSANPELRPLLLESVYRVRSMALIHQMLYGVMSLERVDFGDYARTLAQSLRSTLAPALRVRLDCASIELTVDVAVPLGLILNELLTNAFKYGKPLVVEEADWDVRVSLENLDGKELRLIVADRGPGLPPSLRLQTASTLGLQLVRTLGRQLRARFEVGDGPGASFSLRCLQRIGG